MTLATTQFTPVGVGANYANITSSTLLKTGDGFLFGVFVASSTGGTIKVWDQTSAAVPVLVNTFTPDLGWTPIPFRFTKGLYITIANTIDCTFSFV